MGECESVPVCPPRAANDLWRDYVAINGQTAILPHETPLNEDYIISVNFVRVTASQTTRVFNVRKVCRSYQHMLSLKHSIEQVLCLPNDQVYHDIDKPRNLAKSVTVE
jgi:hypothetical protein